MKYVDEFRNQASVNAVARAIRQTIRQPRVIMEVCGGQTHAIVRYGLDRLLPPDITLIHGPGCPVCVTPLELIDAALQLAGLPEVIFCSFGDMLRVPGTQGDLLGVKAKGGDVRIVYSPLDALTIAQAHPSNTVVFFAVGFETTAPANAMTVMQAHRLGLTNFCMLVAHVLVPPAMEAILSSPTNRVEGFLAAGHVCAVMGYEAYDRIAATYRVPIVVTGFEPLDILEGVHLVVQQLEQGQATVQNQYSRAVKKPGNSEAQKVVQEVFEPTSRTWRGMQRLPESGLRLREAYHRFDALRRFHDRLLVQETSSEMNDCVSGLILQGQLKPSGCPSFGTRCTPDHPLGAPMVSSEGACAAYYRYRSPAT